MHSFGIPWCFAEVLSQTDSMFVCFESRDYEKLSRCIQTSGAENLFVVDYLAAILYRTFLVPNYAIAVSCDVKNCTSSAVIFGSYEGRDDNQVLLRDMLKRYEEMAWHPLLLPILAIELATERSRFMMNGCKAEVHKLEQKTGHHPYDRGKTIERQINDQREARDHQHLQHTQLSGQKLLDLRLDAIRIIGTCAIHDTNTKSRLLCVQDAERAFDKIMSDTTMCEREQFHASSNKLRNIIAYVTAKNKMLLDKVEHVQQIAKMQLDVVSIETLRSEPTIHCFNG